jgi:hypothetical protein
VLDLEIVVQVPGVVVVDEHQRLADRDSGVCPEDRGVLVGLAQRPYVKLMVAHRMFLPEG